MSRRLTDCARARSSWSARTAMSGSSRRAPTTTRWHCIGHLLDLQQLGEAIDEQIEAEGELGVERRTRHMTRGGASDRETLRVQALVQRAEFVWFGFLVRS